MVLVESKDKPAFLNPDENTCKTVSAWLRKTLSHLLFPAWRFLSSRNCPNREKRCIKIVNGFVFFSPPYVRGALILCSFIDSASGAHYWLTRHSHRRKKPKDKTVLNLQWQPFINQATVWLQTNHHCFVYYTKVGDGLASKCRKSRKCVWNGTNTCWETSV